MKERTEQSEEMKGLRKGNKERKRGMEQKTKRNQRKKMRV